jgi:hypothetical protein
MSPTTRSPVLSLTVLDAATLDDGVLLPDSSVLIVARRPDANPTHPNVISVPTQRLPESLYHDIVATATPDERPSTEGVFLYRDGDVDSRVDNGHSPLIFAVESLLGRKLGLSEGLESGAVHFRAGLRSLVQGTAVYDNFGADDVYEPIDMLNLVVLLTAGRGTLPAVTRSYGPIGWTTVESFLDGVESRDPRRIEPTLDSIEFCVHGVCLSAARETLVSLLGKRPLTSREALTQAPLTWNEQ